MSRCRCRKSDSVGDHLTRAAIWIDSQTRVSTASLIWDDVRALNPLFDHIMKASLDRHLLSARISIRMTAPGTDRHCCSALIGSDRRYTGHVFDIVNLALLTL